MKKIVIGIDPGITGAIGVLYPDSECGRIGCSVYDMPTVSVPNKRRKEVVLDISAFAELISDLTEFLDAEVWLEKTQPMRDSAMTAFSMGQMRGMLLATLRMKRIPVHDVLPTEWKKFCGLLGCDKDASRNVAATQIPESAPYLLRKRDHNRAEGLLIAYYGLKKKG